MWLSVVNFFSYYLRNLIFEKKTFNHSRRYITKEIEGRWKRGFHYGNLYRKVIFMIDGLDGQIGLQKDEDGKGKGKSME